MTVNTAILMNDQYNTTLQLIEDMQYQLNNIDIDNVVLLCNIEENLNTLESQIHKAKNKIKNEVEL